jgi:hypothetical protein
MRKLIVAVVVLAVVAGLLAVGDVAARRYAESRIEQQIDHRDAGASSSVHISSFPFVPRLLLFGRVEKITAHVKHVSVSSLTLDQVDLTVTGVKLDRNQLFHRNVVVKSIRTGTVSAVLTEQAVEDVLHLPVTFGDGSVQLTVGGVTLGVSVAVVDNQLRLSAAGQELTVPIPVLPVLPCVAGVTVEPGRLILSCTFHQVPTALLQAAAARARPPAAAPSAAGATAA